VAPQGHTTKPPARLTEASLVKRLEEAGIGRPSTYASIISTIQDRGYVVKAGNQLRPTFMALAVTRLLEQHFPKLVDETFTAGMEQTLDDIATGAAAPVPYLTEFYLGDQGLDAQVRSHEEQIDPRQACTVELDGLDARIRVGRFGPYLVAERDGENLTASLPDDLAPAEITNELAEKLIEQKRQPRRPLGTHPEQGLPVYSLIGPFGPYVQLGDAGGNGEKPKRVSIPRSIDPQTLTLETALDLLSLPRDLGAHPESGKPVKAGIGRYGPYVFHDGVYKSIPKDQNILATDLATAVELLKQARPRGGAAPLRELGAHPEDGQPVQLFSGRYGPYVKHNKVNATLPKDASIDNVTLEQALDLLKERASRGPTRKRTKAPKQNTPRKRKPTA
jgi:DNA topoisomerase-1